MKKAFGGKKMGAGLLAGIAMAATLLPPSMALAGIGEELTLAQQHALLAYRSGGRGVGGAKTHLQHVLNCLVGPGGDGYNATPPMMDPCASSGKGALNDAVSPAQKTKITAAIGMVKAAFAIEDPEKMQATATEIADAVGAAKE
jgi:hypothetical protein